MVDHRLGVGLLRDVGRDGRRLAAGGLDDSAVSEPAISLVRRRRRPARPPRRTSGRPAAHAAAGAGDDRDLVGETHGGRPPGRRSGEVPDGTHPMVLVVAGPGAPSAARCAQPSRSRRSSITETAATSERRSRAGTREEPLQGGDAAGASGDEDLAAPLRGRDELTPPIGGVRRPRHEPVLLQRRHEPGHRRCGHALVAGEPADRPRPAEHQHGQGRETRRALAAGAILAGQSPEQMEDGRMESRARGRRRAGLTSAPSIVS